MAEPRSRCRPLRPQMDAPASRPMAQSIAPIWMAIFRRKVIFDIVSRLGGFGVRIGKWGRQKVERSRKSKCKIRPEKSHGRLGRHCRARGGGGVAEGLSTAGESRRCRRSFPGDIPGGPFVCAARGG